MSTQHDGDGIVTGQKCKHMHCRTVYSSTKMSRTESATQKLVLGVEYVQCSHY